MDVRLKGRMSGIESAKIIQSHRNVPVIFTTAYSSVQFDEFNESLKKVQFLAKPINVNELALAVRSALGTT
jgi:DNA-binding LytR/AlgR family response regulator